MNQTRKCTFEGTGINIEVPSDADQILVTLDGKLIDVFSYTIKLKTPELKDIIIEGLEYGTHTVLFSYNTNTTYEFPKLSSFETDVDFAQLITDL